MARITETEFEGDENYGIPGNKGREIRPNEMLRLMHQTDPADETSGGEVVSQKS